jgi:ribosome-binding protein aMBF1 (putative translation factor)
MIYKHECPNCGEPTHGAITPGAPMAICQDCYEAFYGDEADDEVYARRRRKRDERIAEAKREAEEKRRRASFWGPIRADD